MATCIKCGSVSMEIRMNLIWSSRDSPELRRPPRVRGLPPRSLWNFWVVEPSSRLGPDGVVGTDHVAHGAADTSVGRVGLLADAVKNGMFIFGLFHQACGGNYLALAEYTEFNSVDRTDRSAATALGTEIFVPLDLPVQVFNA